MLWIKNDKSISDEPKQLKTDTDKINVDNLARDAGLKAALDILEYLDVDVKMHVKEGRIKLYGADGKPLPKKSKPLKIMSDNKVYDGELTLLNELYTNVSSDFDNVTAMVTDKSGFDKYMHNVPEHLVRELNKTETDVKHTFSLNNLQALFSKQFEIENHNTFNVKFEKDKEHTIKFNLDETVKEQFKKGYFESNGNNYDKAYIVVKILFKETNNIEYAYKRIDTSTLAHSKNLEIAGLSGQGDTKINIEMVIERSDTGSRAAFNIYLKDGIEVN